MLKETFGPGKEIRSGKLELTFAFDGTTTQTGTDPVKLSLKGPFASSGKGKVPRFAFDASVDAGGQALAVGALSTGAKGWLKLAGQTFALPDATFQQFRASYEKDQARAAAPATGPSFAALGIDPAGWLARPRKAAEEDVGGTRTVHVTSNSRLTTSASAPRPAARPRR